MPVTPRNKPGVDFWQQHRYTSTMTEPTPSNLPPREECQWHNIPQELRERNQWCVAQYPQKVPHRIVGGKAFPVDVRDLSLLHSYEDAYAFCVANASEAWRLGFALSESDPYVCIDVDYDSLDDDSKARIGGIVFGFNSFTEHSTSNRGCHVWIRGSVADGSRAAGIEVYSRARFIIMTGVPIHESLNVPIAERELELQSLREYLDSRKAVAAPQGVVAAVVEDIAEQEDDDALLNRILPFMREGGKFTELWEGKWHGYGYPSQSEADDALMAILVRFTRNREQLKRIFLKSALGDRILHPERHGKKKPKDYLDRTINSAFQTLWEPEVDLSEFIETAEETFESDKESKDSFDELGWPPGHLGQIALWIYQNARLPNRTIALATAFAIGSGLVGNAWSFGDGTQGCNLYTVIAGPSGIGKNGGAAAISQIVAACAGKDGRGPIKDYYNFVNYVSAPGLRKVFLTQRQFLNIKKEFGDFLLAMVQSSTSLRWSDYGSLFKDLYHESGVRSVVGGLGYSDKENNVDSMYGVCYSVFGETTPDTLFSNFTSNVSEDGLVSRLSVFLTTKARPLANYNRSPFPKHLVKLLQEMTDMAVERNGGGTTVVVPITEDAQELFNTKDGEWTDKINGLSQTEHLMRSQYNRLNVKALKYATIIAVFANPKNPIVTTTEMEYGIRLAEISAEDILKASEAGLVGADDTARIDAFESKVRAFFKGRVKKNWRDSWKKMRSEGCVPYSYLYDRLHKVRCFRECNAGFQRIFDSCATILESRGIIVEMNPLDVLKNYGTKARVFKVVG